MTLKLFENILRMKTKETSLKTEQLVVSPGHKLNNEQFCYKINLFLAENGENLISAQPRISAHLE